MKCQSVSLPLIINIHIFIFKADGLIAQGWKLSKREVSSIREQPMKHKHSQNTWLMLAGCHSTFLNLNQHNLRSFSHWPVQIHFKKIATILAKPLDLPIVSLLKDMQNITVKKKRKIILNWRYSDSHTCLSNTDLIALPSWIRGYGNLLKFPSKGHGELLLVGFFSSMVHKDNGHVMLLIYTPNLHLKDRGVTIASSIRIR